MIAERRTVAALAVIDLARELRRHSVIGDVDIRRIDRQLAEKVVDLESGRDVSELQEQRYPEEWLVALWRLADATDHTDIGARIGSTVSPEAGGLLANLMLHCENLQEVLDTYLSNIGLLNTAESWQAKRSGGFVELTFDFISRHVYPQCAIERSVVAFRYWAKYISGADIPFHSVEFSFPEPAHADYLRAQFPCDVTFCSGRNALTFDESLLARPQPRRNRYLKNMLEQRIAALELLGGERSVEVRVRELLARNMASCHTAGEVAKALCMSRATLYRRLREEGSSFSAVLDEERQALAQRYRHEPVAALCDVLGFRDASAYYKARRRWKAAWGSRNLPSRQ